MQELSNLDNKVKQDSHLFYKRLRFIKRNLEFEVEPMRQISKDHARTNKNGIKLDYLDRMGERHVPLPEMSTFPAAMSTV